MQLNLSLVQGEQILDQEKKLTLPLAEDYEQCKQETWSSKSMIKLIQSQKSNSHALP